MRYNLTNLAIFVIIPVYNVESYIQRCLQSIVDDCICSFGRVEVIIIDDGLTDASAEIAEKYVANYNFVSVACTRNVEIHEAKGKWLYFVDSDNWLAKHALTSFK